MSIDYTVAATLVLQGDGATSAKLDGVARRAEHTRSALLSIGRGAASGMATVGAAVERTIDRMASLTVATAKWGAIAAVGGAIAATKVGLVNVNAELEKTELGFATMFTMFGSAPNFAVGLGMGKELLAGIRQDAAALPGEFQDFASMAQTMTAPLTQLGQNLDGIRRVTRETVVTAAALGINFDQASREMAMLLEGHAGAHNVFGMRLGIRADTMVNGRAWHEAAGLDRLKYIESIVGGQKMSAALDAYSHSWAGLTSTIVDSLKRFAGDATAPLFGRIKGSLSSLIDWENRHERQIDRVAYVVGTKLVAAYDWLEDRVRWVVTHWDTIEGKVESVTDALVTGFERAWPIVQKVGSFLEDKLEHPTTALKELVALRLGASALTMAPRAIDAFARMKGSGNAIASGATDVDAATKSLATAASFSKYGEHAIPEAGLFAGASGAGTGGAEVVTSLGGLAAGAGAATLALAALAGAVDILTVNTKEESGLLKWMGETGQEMWREVKQNFGSAIAETKETFSSLWHAVRPLVDLLGIALLGAVDLVIYNFRLLLTPIRLLADGISYAVSLIPGYGDKAKGGGLPNFASDLDAVVQKQVDWWLNGPKAIKPDFGPDIPDSGRPIQKPPVVDARGSRFEIRLDVRNDNPDRIVRRVFDAIGNAAARPLTSSYAPPAKAF